MAELATFIGARREPTGPVETFSTEAATETVTREIATEDAATHPAALRERRARLGQRQPDQRRPEELAPVRDRRLDRRRWPGTRSSPTSCGSAIASGPTRSSSRTRRSWARPGGPRPRSRAATSKASPTRSARTSGRSTPTSSAGRPAARPAYPTFADGHDEMLVNDAIAESARTRSLGRRGPRPGRCRGSGRGGPIPMKLGLLTAPFPETPLAGRRRLDGRQRLREHRDRLLAAHDRADPALCRHVAHRRREPVGEPGDRDRRRDRRQGPDHLRPRLLPEPAPSGPGASRRGHRPPQARHHRGRGDGRPATSTRSWAPTARRTRTTTGRRRSGSGRTSCAFAQDHGRKITIENCPMLFSYDEWPGGHNIATTPAHLAPDPRDVGRHDRAQLRPVAPDPADDRHPALHPRVRAAHPARPGQGPDDRSRRALRARHLLGGIGWQVPRLPGLGDVDWSVLFSALYRAGYDGDVIIEHEDRDFEGTDELVKRGFLLARDVLRPYIV